MRSLLLLLFLVFATASYHKPCYHYHAGQNWLNDPNGPVYWQGYYHLFYQYNPKAPVWGPPSWGHARSVDMIHWERLPIAIAPSTTGGPDSKGVWSGSATVHEDRVFVFYTAPHPQRQLGALGLGSDLRGFEKFPYNPVVKGVPSHFTAFRDPSVIPVAREGNKTHWAMLIGAGIDMQGPPSIAALTATTIDGESTPFRKWRWAGVVAHGDPEESGFEWECPDYFELPRGHRSESGSGDAPDTSGVVIASVNHAFFTQYFLNVSLPLHGRESVLLERSLMFDYGCAYAPKSFHDPVRNRRIIWNWIREERSKAELRKDGWAGAIGLPRVLQHCHTADPRIVPRDAPDMLCQTIAHEARALRDPRRRIHKETFSFAPGAVALLLPAERDPSLPHGARCELRLEVDLTRSHDASFRLILRKASANREYTALVFRRHASLPRVDITLDRTHTSLNPGVKNDSKTAVVPFAPEVLSIALYVDHSACELIVNEVTSLTFRTYPTLRDSLGMELVSDARTPLEVARLDLWEMHPVWDDPHCSS